MLVKQAIQRVRAVPLNAVYAKQERRIVPINNKIKCVCSNINCNKEFFVDPCRKNTVKFCSRKCKDTTPMTEEQKEKIRRNAKINPNFGTKGKKFSKEVRRKMSKNHKGGVSKGYKPSPERGLKISAAKKGHKQKEITKEKIRKNAKINPNFGMKGKKHSESTKNKMRIIRLQNPTIIYNTSISSKSELEWGKQIQKLYNVELDHSFWLEGRCFDYKFENYLFELDGSYWHSSEEQLLNDKFKNNIAYNNGYILIRIPLNKVKDVPEVIQQHSGVLNIIFEVKRGVLNNVG